MTNEAREMTTTEWSWSPAPAADEKLAEIETALRINERPVREIAPSVHDAATDLLAEVRRLLAENERLRQGAAEAYQMAGNSDYPVGYMANFLALAEGELPPYAWCVLRKEDHAARRQTV